MYDLEKDILEATAYKSGYVNEEDKYVISASMVAKEPIQNYLSILHGKIEADKVNDATLGSVFHKGMEEIMLNKQLKDIGEKDSSVIWGIEHSMHTELSNGWILSGTADLVVETIPGHFEIRDYKLTKSYAHKMFLKEKYGHEYTKQLQVLEALFREGKKRPKIIEGQTTLVCDYFVKDSKAIEFEVSHRPEQVPNKEGIEDVRASEVTLMEVVEITNSLQAYLESGEVPPECQDKWLRNVKGVTIPSKCVLYCSHNKVCPYYDANTRTTTNRLAGW